VPDDFREIAAALDVPLGWLVGSVVCGFVTLVAAVTTRSVVAATISSLVSLAIAGAGLRAVLRPTRPLHLSQEAQVPHVRTSRQLGAFYVLAGLVSVMLSLIALVVPS
jgi:branched-subunit amino acid transport protein